MCVHVCVCVCVCDCMCDYNTLIVINKIYVAPYTGMIASTVIAVKIRSWIGAPTVCDLLPTDSFAGIGVLRTRLN